MSLKTDPLLAQPHPRNTPTPIENLIFQAKAIGLQLQRSWRNWHDPSIRKWPQRSQLTAANIYAESRTDLWVGATASEWILQAGKIHNLRLAIRSIDGIEIPAGQVFSFWKQVGKPSARNGFTTGRELRQGCIVPNIGGGLCQLSNALYDTALQANLEIIERYRHSQVIPGSLAEIDRDATVFWNYIDLKFRSTADVRIEAIMDDTQLVVRFKIATPQVSRVDPPIVAVPQPIETINNCLSCSVTSCFRNQSSDRQGVSRTAYLVDDRWAEFDRYLQTVSTKRDCIYVPIDGQKFRRSNYAWQTDEFDRVSQYWWFAADRAWQSRKLANQGAARQQMLMAQSRSLALKYGKNLTPDTTHLVITQSLLPWLWAAGYLGGRTFDVLMTGLPIVHLQQRLDRASKLYPHSSTLSDFRAVPEVAEWEIAAFKRARKIITPHTDLARLWPDRTELLDWELPPTIDRQIHDRVARRATIVLPSSSLGRKGIYELRAAIIDLDVDLIIAGGNLENREFWQGYAVSFQPDYALALQQADLVVLPAWVEHQPRRILQAVAAGIPTIVSNACGLDRLPNITSVTLGDVRGLQQAIVTNLKLPTNDRRLLVL
jgi:glycosyltransferase involved in cell wall biosynthesis